MEVLIIIAVLILAIIIVLSMVATLLWAEKGVNKSVKDLEDKQNEQERSRQN